MNHIDWINDYADALDASRDPAQELDNLQRNVADPQPGDDIHHIVERASAVRAGYMDEDIDGAANLVRIPRLAHYQITGWYMSPNDQFGGMSPRQYLEDKSWEERRTVGLMALRRFGVMK